MEERRSNSVSARTLSLWRQKHANTQCHCRPVFDDVQPVRWLKVAINIAWNPVTALTLCDDANYLRSSDRSDVMIVKIMKEIGRVATAVGYPDAITDEVIASDLERPRSRLASGGKEPSMLTDVRAQRPIEVEAILGNALRIAEGLNVHAPYLELLYTLAKARNYEIEKPIGSWKPIAIARDAQPNGTTVS